MDFSADILLKCVTTSIIMHGLFSDVSMPGTYQIVSNFQESLKLTCITNFETFGT